MPEAEVNYNKVLYQELTAKARGMTEEEKARFFLDVAVLERNSMVGGEIGENRQAMYRFLTDYMAPRDENGVLDKALFEQRLKEIEKSQVERVYRPMAQFMAEKGDQHSDNWLYEQFNFNTKYGALRQNVANLFATVFGDDPEVSESITRAYQVGDSYGLVRNKWEETKLEVLRESGDWDWFKPALYLVGNPEMIYDGKSEEYKNEKKAKRAQEHFLSKAELKESASKLSQEITSGIDLSFLDDEQEWYVRMGIREAHDQEPSGWMESPEYESTRSYQKVYDSISQLSEELEDAAGMRLTDSSAFNAVRDRVAGVRKLLKRGDTPENRQALGDALRSLERESQAYQDKNPGVRRTRRGNERKRIIDDLQKMARENAEALTARERNQAKAAEDKKTYLKEAAEAMNGEKENAYTRELEAALVSGGTDPQRAKRDVNEAVTLMMGNPGRMEKMSTLMNRCRKAMGTMDVRAEALKALGVKDPSSLSKEEMRGILSAPEHQDALNDFYVSLRERWMLLRPETTHPALKAVYQYMKANQTLERDLNYERTSDALIKGLEGEARWKQMRERYQSGDRTMDVVHLAALKASIQVQREAVIERGSLSGQNRLQSEVIQGLAAKTEEFLRDEPKDQRMRDFRGATEGLTVQGLMEGHERLPKVEAAMAAAAYERTKEVELEHLDKEMGADWCRKLRGIHNAAYIPQIDRKPTANHILMGFMGMKGIDFLTAIDDSEERQKAGRELEEFLKKNELNLDEKGAISEEQDPEVIENIVKFYRGCKTQIGMQGIPDIDYEDPVQRTANCVYGHQMDLMMLDMDQSIGAIAKYQPFQEKYGNAKMLARDRAMQNSVQEVFGFIQVDDRNKSVSQAGFCNLKLYADKVRGGNISNLGDSLKEHVDALGIPRTLYAQNMDEPVDSYMNGDRTLDVAEFKEKVTEPIKDEFKKIEETLEGIQKGPGNLAKNSGRSRVDVKTFLAEDKKKAPARQSLRENSVQKKMEQGGKGMK